MKEASVVKKEADDALVNVVVLPVSFISLFLHYRRKVKIHVCLKKYGYY